MLRLLAGTCLTTGRRPTATFVQVVAFKLLRVILTGAREDNLQFFINANTKQQFN
jgi:hypothetical protein